MISLEDALVVTAYIVSRHGEAYGPLLERIERELDEKARRPSATDRARQILANSKREVKHAEAV